MAYDVFYDFPDGLPKIHEDDGEPARGYGLASTYTTATRATSATAGRTRRCMATHAELREAALRMGVNLFLYAMSSAPAG